MRGTAAERVFEFLEEPEETPAPIVEASFAGLTGESRQLNILGPTPAFYERQRDNWRWQIVVRSSTRN